MRRDRFALVCAAALISACGGGSSTPTAVEVPGELIGRVEVAEDVPLGNCAVLLEGAPLGARCDASGQFDIKNVPPGRWDMRLIPDTTSGLPARRVAAASNSGFVTDVGALRIAPTGSVGGHVIASQGAPPFAIISVPAYGVVTAPNTNGGYLLEKVPPGVHDVVLTTDAGVVIHGNVTVLPSKTTIGVDFDLSQASGITAKLTGTAQKLDRTPLGLIPAPDASGMTVELVDALKGTVITSATTDKDGHYTIDATQGSFVLRLKDSKRKATAIIPYVLVYQSGPNTVGQTMSLPPDDADLDGDGLTGADDSDQDGDGAADTDDSFPLDPAEQGDGDADGLGDHADLQTMSQSGVDTQTPTPDTDGDGKLDFEDNCVGTQNADQKDSDADGVGDVCDNCPFIANPDQLDSLGNGEGNACRTCIDGADCTPANACHIGFLSCTAQGPVCADTGSDKPNGDPCGVDMYCSAGACTPCMQGDTCALVSNPCVQGAIECQTGVPVCAATMVNVADGSPCGANQVCKGGACVACTTGASCTPAADPCHAGAVVCTSGDPVCMATATAVSDGTGCGTNLFCNAGACVACPQGDACQPANICHAGHFECGTGSAVCTDDGTPANDFQACGAPGQFCQAGSCVTLTDTLSLTGGGGQSGAVGALLSTPVTLTLKDGGGNPIVGRTVTMTVPAGGVSTPASAPTGSGGTVIFSLRLPPSAGTFQYTATTTNAAPVNISETATLAGTTGEGATIANVDHSTSGGENLGGPAVLAHFSSPNGMTIAADGSIYFVDPGNVKIKKIAPDGTLTVVAGVGGANGFAGDGGQATAAVLNAPTDVAVDDVAHVLYIADSGNARIRAVDLTTGIISTFAGGGPGGAADPFGDGGPATSATLQQPTQLAINPIDRSLWFSDNSHNRIRRIDRVSRIISTPLDSSGCGGAVSLTSCNAGVTHCSLAFDPAGRLFVGGFICGAATNGSSTIGILRFDPDSTQHPVGGVSGGTSSDNVPAASAGIADVTDLALDAAGNLFFIDDSGAGRKVRRIDGTTTVITTVAGNGTSATAPEFSPALGNPLNDPQSIAFTATNDAIVVERGAHSLRKFYGMGSSVATPGLLAMVSGNNQSTAVGSIAPAALQVKFTSGGNGVGGAQVAYTAADPAVGVLGSPAGTGPTGTAVLAVRAPLKAGAYTVQASVADLHGQPVTGSPVSFTFNATNPAAGTIYTALDADHTAGFSGMGGPATLAHIGAPRYVAVASDGTIYACDFTRVYRVTPAGVVDVLAGTGNSNFNGDFGTATLINFGNCAGLALDEADGILYLSDASNARIRAIDLASGSMYKYAGGGTASGDGGPATSAQIANRGIAFEPATGIVYLFDLGLSRVRAIAPLSPPGTPGGTISTVFSAASTSCSNPIGIFDFFGLQGEIAIDASGNIYLGARVCGTSPGGVATGIIRRNTDGSFTHIAGQASGGSNADGTLATSYSFGSDDIAGLTIAGNLLYYSPGSGGSRVRVIDVSQGAAATVNTVAGTGTAGFNGDYISATTAQLSLPFGIAAVNGHLYICDQNNDSVRIVQ
jgi:sugar lactone lactonase YvrE